MTSENYRQLLNNEFEAKEMTKEDFDNTLMHFAMLYSKEQLRLCGVSCSFADKEILSNSLRFALTETPQDEQGALKDFKKYQALMRKCMLWLKDNYEPPCDGFMNECEA
jgi:hypothetical protein